MRHLGLDMSDTVIRLVALERHGHHVRLPVHGDIPLPVGAIVDGDILNQEAVVEAIRSLVAAAKPKTKSVSAALPERHSFLKVLPISGDGPINDNTVLAEAAQHIPYQIEDVYTSWQLLPSQPTKRQVLFGASPKEVVDLYLSTLRQAGLDVLRLELESIALTRALLPEDQSSAVIILDLGTTRSTISLVANGLVRFTTTLRYGGKDLDTYIAESLSISPDQARKAKTLFGLDEQRGKGLLAKVLKPQLELLAKEILKVSTYAQQQLATDGVSQVYLTGSGALIRGMAEALREHVSVPVNAQPVPLVANLPSAPDADELSYTYATAIGLALEASYD